MSWASSPRNTRQKAQLRVPEAPLYSAHVDDVAEMLKKVLAKGAKEYEPLINREAGFVTASVVDPFGNILGLMCNPHYLEILASKDA